MIVTEQDTAGRLVSRWDSAAGTFTTYTQSGAVLSQRALTARELAVFAEQDDAAVAVANASTLEGRARAALTGNRTFLALASPTNAQTLAQVRLLTKECNALIRIALGLFDDVADTS